LLEFETVGTVSRPLVGAVAVSLALALGVTVLPARPASADMYTYTDSDGVVHFTNIEPSGRDRHKWRTLYKTGPGKAGAIRAGGGPCEKCDTVPARDASPERFSRYDAFIHEAADLYQIPEALIRAVIQIESDYDPRVVSYVGAQGLMQLMPESSNEEHVPDPFDPRDNILGGTRQLRVLANRYNGDIVLTLAAYNAGPGAVAKYGGVPPYESTQLYVRMVLQQYYRYKAKLERGPAPR
jgi:soluble lytic murein transglycosylase-like protein